jgi:hypothetical protein
MDKDEMEVPHASKDTAAGAAVWRNRVSSNELGLANAEDTKKARLVLRWDCFIILLHTYIQYLIGKDDIQKDV